MLRSGISPTPVAQILAERGFYVNAMGPDYVD